MINFDIHKEGFELTRAMAERARAMELKARTHRHVRKVDEIQMDLIAVHNSIGLQLRELAAADDFNFAHDVFGIERHLNRKTGKLEGCFLPRYARKKEKA